MVRRVFELVRDETRVDLLSDDSRRPMTAEAREIAAHVLRHSVGLSWPKVARELGRDHSTVLEAVRRLRGKPYLRDTVEWIELVINTEARASERSGVA